MAARISVDTFYDKQKALYDICGNVINNDKYPFVDILSKYLTDIVGLIDIEIKNSARNSMINWREKKNPKLLSRLINSDENVNLINMSMNKITCSNFMNIVAEISDALINDNHRKLPDYCSFLFDVVIKKCMIDEAFTKDYIRFLFGFKDNISKHLHENIKKFIDESHEFLKTNKALKDYSYFHYVKDVMLWRNVGVIYANIYKSQTINDVGNASAFIKPDDIIHDLEMQFDILFTILDWLPANMDELNSRLFMVFAIMEILIDDIWVQFCDKSRKLFSEILTLVYNCANIPNKIKFKVLDLQDMIKHKHVIVPVESKQVVKLENADVHVNVNTNIESVHVVSPVPAVSTVPLVSAVPAVPTVSTVSNNQNQVNIWEARKQQQKQLAEVQSQSVVRPSINNKQRNNKNSDEIIIEGKDTSENHLESKNRNRYKNRQGNVNGNKHKNMNGYKNDKEFYNKVDNVQHDTAKTNDDTPSKNRFSSLETIEPLETGTSQPISKINKHNQTNEKCEQLESASKGDSNIPNDDDFIMVEKKQKNIYKPKKSNSMAIEGRKIYDTKRK